MFFKKENVTKEFGQFCEIALGDTRAAPEFLDLVEEESVYFWVALVCYIMRRLSQFYFQTKARGLLFLLKYTKH